MANIDIRPTAPPDGRLDGPIHEFFGLTYSNYLVLHRTFMQSMPVEWQERAVALFEELDGAFDHVEKANVYEVTASVESYYSDLTGAEMRELGVSQPDAAEGEDGDGDDESPSDVYYDKDGKEHDAYDQLLTPRPGGDPVPHYNRGRTYIEPRLDSETR